MPKKNTPGCPCGCASTCARACVVVTGCNSAPLPVAAQVALIQGGVTVASGTATGQVTAITVPLGGRGSGYLTPPPVTISGGGGSGAAAVAVLGTGISGSPADAVVAIFITAYGTGFAATPTVTVDPPPSGTTATATATVATRVCLGYANTGATTIQVTTPAGSGYAAATTSSQALSCTSPTLTVNVPLDADHVCCAGCASPIPKVLTGTDSSGAFPMTWDGTAHWVGSSNHTHAGILSFTGDACNAGSVTAPVFYSLRCSPSKQFLLSQTFYTVCKCCSTACGGGAFCFSGTFCDPAIVIPAACAASAGAGAAIAGITDLVATGNPPCLGAPLSFDFSASDHCNVIEAGIVVIHG